MSHGLALLWWLLFLALAVATTGTLPTLMAPGMRWTVWATLAVLIVLAAGLLLRRIRVHRHGDDAGWPSEALHAVPLLVLILLGSGDLGSAALGAGPVRPRATVSAGERTGSTPAAPATKPQPGPATAAVALPPQERPAWLPGDDLPGPAPADPAASSVASANPPPADLQPAAVPFDLLRMHYPERHPGVQRVRAIGRVLDPESLQGRYVATAAPDRRAKATIYRFVMTCCAADAAPVYCRLHDGGIPVSGLPANDSWVEIEGRWIPPVDVDGTPAVAVDRITAVPAPAEPYLAPDYGR